VDMTDFELYGMNPARFVLMVDGSPVGGTFDPETGLFVIDTVLYTGIFEIAYVPNLRRVTLGLDSDIITDRVYGGLTQMDTLPIIVQDRTMIPIRFVAESLGANVAWDADRRRATVVLGGNELAISPDELLPGMEAPAFILNDRMMLPLRFVAEYFGAAVNFDETTLQIEILLK